MKTSSAAKPLSPAAARNYVVLNQLGTPGLGSILAGWRFAGAGQLLLALSGSGMFIGWVFRAVYNQLVDSMEPHSASRLGIVGVSIFAVAWIWALVTSRQILRAAKQSQPPGGIPPRLTP